MTGKTIIQGNLGVTQTIDSGKALAQFLGLKESLPQVISLANGARLSLSAKKDCYYFTNSRGCSCRAGQFGRDCKHKKALQEGASLSPSEPLSLSPSLPASHSSRQEKARASVAQSRTQAQAYQARQRQLRAQVKEISSQVMGEEPLIQRGGFKPFLED
jgi:hypothetical protein